MGVGVVIGDVEGIGVDAGGRLGLGIAWGFGSVSKGMNVTVPKLKSFLWS